MIGLSLERRKSRCNVDDEQHFLVTAHSNRPYMEAMSLVAQGAREKLGGVVEVHGVDHAKAAAERQQLTEERTEALTAYHRVDETLKQSRAAVARLLAGLESIASFECRCDDDTAEYSEDATEEDTACAACLAQIIFDRERHDEAQ